MSSYVGDTGRQLVYHWREGEGGREIMTTKVTVNNADDYSGTSE